MATVFTAPDLLIGQWRNSPQIRALIETFQRGLRNHFDQPLEELPRQRRLTDAEGVWLDYIGSWLGLDRPWTIIGAMDDRFGFEMAGVAFNRAPFRGSRFNDELAPLPDPIYTRFLEARGLALLSDGTFPAFAKAVLRVDPGASVVDLLDMSIRIVSDARELIELADKVGALPRSAGVRLLIRDKGRFGFEASGVAFGQGPFA